jgi:hypothetical protein
MSKTITIPSDRGSRIIVDINGVEYVYAAGATVTVPDEVAACIADAVAMKPGGHRESKFDEAHESLEARVEALEAGGGGGSELPEVSATDNGDVLTVVEGAWAKAAPSGGGVLVVTMDESTGALDKTWAEIKAAAPFVTLDDEGSYCPISACVFNGLTNKYICKFAAFNGTSLGEYTFQADSESGYPVYQE